MLIARAAGHDHGHAVVDDLLRRRATALRPEAHIRSMSCRNGNGKPGCRHRPPGECCSPVPLLRGAAENDVLHSAPRRRRARSASVTQCAEVRRVGVVEGAANALPIGCGDRDDDGFTHGELLASRVRI